MSLVCIKSDSVSGVHHAGDTEGISLTHSSGGGTVAKLTTELLAGNRARHISRIQKGLTARRA